MRRHIRIKRIQGHGQGNRRRKAFDGRSLATKTFHLIAMIRFRARSIRKLFPGGITVVALYSVIMAGPIIDFSAMRLSLLKMGGMTPFPSNTTFFFAAGSHWLTVFPDLVIRSPSLAGSFTPARKRKVTNSICFAGW